MPLKQEDTSALCVPSFKECCLLERALFHMEKLRSTSHDVCGMVRTRQRDLYIKGTMFTGSQSPMVSIISSTTLVTMEQHQDLPNTTRENGKWKNGTTGTTKNFAKDV